MKKSLSLFCLLISITAFGKSTHQMEWLLYTVTFFYKTSDKFSAKHYTGWKNVQGIIVPLKMENYKMEEGEVIGEANSPRTFTDIKLYKEMVDDSIFNEKSKK